MATTMKNDATDAFDEKYLRPLITQLVTVAHSRAW